MHPLSTYRQVRGRIVAVPLHRVGRRAVSNFAYGGPKSYEHIALVFAVDIS